MEIPKKIKKKSIGKQSHIVGYHGSFLNDHIKTPIAKGQV